MAEERTPGKDYANYGNREDFGSAPTGTLSSLGLGGIGSMLMCCLCLSLVFGIAWIVYVIVTISGTPALKAECLDSDLRFFPGSIWDFVVVFLIYTMILPLFIGCLMNVMGPDSGVGRLVRFANTAAAIYFPIWGIMLWTNVSLECDKSFNSDEYANLYFVFKVEVILSAMGSVGAIGDICRPQVDPASLEGGYGYQRFGAGFGGARPPPTAPNPETEGFV